MKDVPGFPPYKVDRYGNVYGFRGKMSPKRKKDGYMQVKLSHEPKPLYRYVHVLVALAYLPKPDTAERLKVNHINGDKGDNRACNLEWVTPRENMRHAIGIPWRCKTRARRAVIRSDGEMFPSMKEAARRSGVSYTTVWNHCHGIKSNSEGYAFRWGEE